MSFIDSLIYSNKKDNYSQECDRFVDGDEIVIDGDQIATVVDSKNGVIYCKDTNVISTINPDGWYSIHRSSWLNQSWESDQLKKAVDGVFTKRSDWEVCRNVRLEFNSVIDALDELDYHPGTNQMILDIVHPSLYCLASDEPETSNDKFDRWGRKWEGSRFQWLPAEVDVDKNGNSKFVSPINNFNGKLSVIEEAFNEALPLLEKSYKYALSKEFFGFEEGSEEEYDKKIKKKSEANSNLSNRRLQVVVKAVEYDIKPGDSFEGVWHVEGMSHENIMATAVLTYDRATETCGGNLQFRRPYTLDEADELSSEVHNPSAAEREFLSRNCIPIGQVNTEAGSWVCFPNSHIHRVTKMESYKKIDEKSEDLFETLGEDKEWLKGLSRSRKRFLLRNYNARKSILVFWLVDPDVRITSTKDIPNPQSLMTKEVAEKNRLLLMEERKLHKQSLNLREVSLCEH